MLKFIENNYKIILGIIAGIMIVSFVTQGIQIYNHNRKYKSIQKELDNLKKLREIEIKARMDSIEQLKKDKIILYDSIRIIDAKLKKKEDEKVKVVYVVKSMSVSEQQSYFTERYKQNSNSGQRNSSISDSRLGDRRYLLRTSGTSKEKNNYFRKRYI